jgi:hypothetical protein
MGNATDDAGHILGRNLGGSAGKDNIFAQAPNINRDQFAQFEKEVASYVKDNGTVKVDIKFDYPKGSGTRPSSATYEIYQGGQKVLSSFFTN